MGLRRETRKHSPAVMPCAPHAERNNNKALIRSSDLAVNSAVPLPSLSPYCTRFQNASPAAGPIGQHQRHASYLVHITPQHILSLAHGGIEHDRLGSTITGVGDGGHSLRFERARCQALLEATDRARRRQARDRCASFPQQTTQTKAFVLG